MSDHFSRCEILGFRPANVTLTSSSIVALFNVFFGDFFIYRAKLHRRHDDGSYFLMLPGNNERINCRDNSETRRIILEEALKLHAAADPVPPRPPKTAEGSAS
ncbi:hypothetical protein I7G59_04705 [Sinorhizobium meliloti]|uniref:hypothetical protein n=1 Tax=Rhizobium meliloti TaxID=382 RepID=UPI00237FEF96|nr:hypothetical protein [Sinorhizobium meliloti]MDE3796628.1 hypothetical protein [Sinorhizobium meliloti]